MVNEEDHLRIQALVDGLELDAAAREAFAAEEMLAKDYPFSFDPQLGYLTSCPTNTGTGLRASLMLHLPLMYQFHMMGTVAQNVAKLGLTLRGIYGEGSEALGNVYQVSNQVTLGRAEQDIIDSVTAVGKQLIATENKMRQRYIDKRSKNICNITMRSYGMMKYAVEMEEKEMLMHWSNLRLGVTLGLIPHSLEQMDELLTRAQDAHVKQYMEQKNLSVGVNEARCCLIRELLSRETAAPVDPYVTGNA
jgi:protein arginine kinase